MEYFFADFASDGKDFDAADGNSYKDYYSDDDDLFSLHDASHSEVLDIVKYLTLGRHRTLRLRYRNL